KEQVALLLDDANRGANATVSVDLEKQEIKGPDGGTITFEIDPFRKQCLLEGLDDIGQTLQAAPTIDAFEQAHKTAQPWLSLNR
ncbi:MAG TPA: 3-isopropylmalate dehydratase small subunit, partial [Vineibacter sp.]|nr:3-isopropylmalate dehydratase small subunit [Vineibacter sp.]